MPDEIATVDEVPAWGSLLFTVELEGEWIEAIAVKQDDEVFCYENYCQHWRDVKLDDGDDAAIRNGEIVCEKHAAMFEIDTGLCNYGPCEGSSLRTIDTETRNGAVYLTDEEYSYVSEGGVEEKDEDDGSFDKGTRGGMDFQI
ncbi:MAG: Rieske (2Fe-2S) protein [Halobacteria archaeon]